MLYLSIGMSSGALLLALIALCRSRLSDGGGSQTHHKELRYTKQDCEVSASCNSTYENIDSRQIYQNLDKRTQETTKDLLQQVPPTSPQENVLPMFDQSIPGYTEPIAAQQECQSSLYQAIDIIPGEN